MKKFTVFLLILVLILSFSACARDLPLEESSEITVQIRRFGEDEAFTLSHDDAVAVFDCLKSDNWVDGTTDCASDVEVTVMDEKYSYHSSCGTFNETDKIRSLHFEEETREIINGIFEKYVPLGDDIIVE